MLFDLYISYTNCHKTQLIIIKSHKGMWDRSNYFNLIQSEMYVSLLHVQKCIIEMFVDLYRFTKKKIYSLRPMHSILLHVKHR